MSTSYTEALGARDVLGAQASGSSTTLNSLDYSSSTGFTYDSSKIEFTNGKASLKNQYASDVVCAATFASGKNLDYSRDGGNTTKIDEAGTITNSGGKLVFTSGANARLVWEGINNLPKSGVGCIRFRWTPNYTGAPASLQYLFQFHELLGATRSYMYFIDNGATMYTQINNGAAATKHSGSYAYSPTSGVEVEVELNWDFGNNSYNLYFDATRRSTAASSAYTADYTDKLIGRMFIGDNNSNAGTVVLNGSVRDLMIFDAVQNSGGTRTTGYVVPTSKYLTTDPTITLTTGVSASSLESFNAVTYASGSDSVKFHILVGAQARYWNGSAWANSNASLAQSNTAAEINTNASSLEAGTYKVVAVLHSDSGATTPSIASVTFETT